MNEKRTYTGMAMGQGGPGFNSRTFQAFLVTYSLELMAVLRAKMRGYGGGHG